MSFASVFKRMLTDTSDNTMILSMNEKGNFLKAFLTWVLDGVGGVLI